MIKSYEMGSLIEVSLPCFVDVFPLLDLDYCLLTLWDHYCFVDVFPLCPQPLFQNSNIKVYKEK